MKLILNFNSLVINNEKKQLEDEGGLPEDDLHSFPTSPRVNTEESIPVQLSVAGRALTEHRSQIKHSIARFSQTSSQVGRLRLPSHLVWSL